MKKSLLFILAPLVAALMACGYQARQKERKFHFRYEVSVWPIEEEGSSVRLWIPLPKNGSYQTISNMTIETPAKVSTHIESVYRNSLAHVSTLSPLPDELTFAVSFDVLRKEQGITPDSLTSPERELHLAPKSRVPRDSRFEEIAETLFSSGQGTMENGRLLYNYILERMAYDKSGEGWGRGDAIYACDIGKGNCTDFHSFFNAVARTADIPARFLIGFPVPEGEEGVIPGYHCWAEFYVPEMGWLPVDISEADQYPEKADYLFGSLDPNRVLFTVGRDIDLLPEARDGPVNFFIYPVLEIDGVRSSRYTTEFTYRSLHY